jgi:competence protein ComEA
MRLATLGLFTALGLVVAAPTWAQTAAPSAAPKAGVATPSTSAPAPARAAEPIDINSATKEQLDALPGIGSARAEAIIKGRPYTGKDDLLRRKIIPENVYSGIKDRIIAHRKS